MEDFRYMSYSGCVMTAYSGDERVGLIDDISCRFGKIRTGYVMFSIIFRPITWSDVLTIKIESYSDHTIIYQTVFLTGVEILTDLSDIVITRRYNYIAASVHSRMPGTDHCRRIIDGN